MKVLVTGGAGFIGSHVVDAHLQAGHEVVVVDNLHSGRLENVDSRARFYLLDIRSAEMGKVLELEQVDAINHQAAQKSVPASVEDPRLDAEINVLGMINLLELAVRHQVQKFIFASTGGALLGDAQQIPTPETAPVKMISPYALTKYAGERYLDFYARTYGLQFTVLRYANVYGPRQVAEGESGVTPIFLENLLHSHPSVLYAYEDMPQGCTRDYVYVGDVAAANLLALTKGKNGVFNIGTGREVSTSHIYSLLQKATGKKEVPLLPGGERLGDLRRSALAITKAQRELGWQPLVSLEEGLALTVEYFKE